MTSGRISKLRSSTPEGTSRRKTPSLEPLARSLDCLLGFRAGDSTEADERVERAIVEDLTLEYEDSGSGHPVVCIHGAFIADTFTPLLSEPSLADRYRLIRYHRRGYAGSSAVVTGGSLVEEAADCRRLLLDLGIERAHVVGHSLGGGIGLQLALDAPQLVATLSLLEPALVVGESAHLYRESLAQSIERYREVGPSIAIDEFFEKRWPRYREHLAQVLPGAFEQSVADAATSFESDLPAALGSEFGQEEARRIAQPVLVVLGEESVALHPRFGEVYRLLLEWMPSAEGFIVPGATHFLHVQSPHVVAEALVEFLARHPERPG